MVFSGGVCLYCHFGWIWLLLLFWPLLSILLPAALALAPALSPALAAAAAVALAPLTPALHTALAPEPPTSIYVVLHRW